MKRAAKAPSGEIKVRMYRQGLGDCFLLSFPGKTRPFFMLIDCGVILGTAKPEEIMSKVAEDVQATTGGTIDLLVATHEHWDHLSGFLQAKPFKEKRIKVKNVWFGWTEDPGNVLANKIRAERRRTAAALHLAMQRATNTTALDHVTQLIGFFGEELGVAGGNNTESALNYLQSQGAAIRYCHPGEPPISLPEVEGIRIYVLGPPEDEAKLKRSDPTARGREVYDDRPALNAASAFMMAALHGPAPDSTLEPDEWELHDRSFPFDSRYRVPPDKAGQDPFFQQRYGLPQPPPQVGPNGGAPSSPAAGAPVSTSSGAAEEWRRIDDDWLGASSELALQLDSDTNNTSLALAIELIGTGQVLLFPGDAQVGNWLSWHELSWKPPGADDKTPPVTATSLLNRTVLYKVGHHASHNATLREKGLMLMTSPDLVAMIPVNQEMALKKRWNMPFPPLRAALEERTRGRVMLVDEGAPLLHRGATLPPHLSEEERKEFERRVVCIDTPADKSSIGYIEYSVPL